MTITKAKSKKVANITFFIITNKVLTQESLSVIEAARQNVLATFPLKNISEKLPLAASGSFSLSLAGDSFPFKVPSKRHIWLVFLTLTTSTTTITTTASQMDIKAKNSKKQQQAVTTAMVTPNSFVVPDKIFIAKQSINPDDLKDWADQMEMESTVPPPVSGAADGGAWENVNGRQRFSGQVASNLLLPGCIGLKSVLQDAESLNGAIKVAIGEEVLLTTLKIARSSGVAFVSSFPLSVALCNVPLGTSPDDIKAALGIFGVVTSVKLKPAGLWQYAVVYFKDIFSAAEAFKHWSVLVKKDNVRILPVVNQREVIASRDAFKAKLVDLFFGCTVFEISDLVSQFVFNSNGGPKVFKSSFAGAKSYAKAVAFVVSPAAAAATGINPVLDSLPKVVVLMVPGISPVPIAVVGSRLAPMKFHLNKLALLIKFIIESVGSLVL
ncbi:hypothetical protein G9A89_009723 [Geosiphon pyriformis]|nr:hypothetical protein G9A89_009723 [Geosiphon pyriformis]